MTFDSTRWTRRRYLLASGLTIGIAGCADSESADDGGDGGGGDGNGDGEQATDTTDGGNGEDTAQTASATVGEVVTGEGMEMVVRNAETTDQIGEFQEADDGNVFQVLRVAVKNTSDGFADFSSHLQASVRDDEDVAYDASFAVTPHPLQSGLLASGEVARGDVVFETPEDVSGLTLIFDLSSFDLFSYSRVEVDLTTEADSPGDLTQSLNVDVNSPGEAVSHENVSVTVNGVRTESELGEYSEAEEGHEFVIPDIEVENGTDEELRVSTLLQMPLKTRTGLTYSASVQSGQLDQKFSEQQPIAPGQTRRGELAYEVETDSAARFWTYNYLEFTNQMKAFWSLD